MRYLTGVQVGTYLDLEPIMLDARYPIRIFDDGLPSPQPEVELGLVQTANLPFVHGVAAMADVGWDGVGSVIATEEAVIPDKVGGDIGCGMTAQELCCDIDDLRPRRDALRAAIEAVIPVGKAGHQNVPEVVGRAYMGTEADNLMPVARTLNAEYIALTNAHGSVLGKGGFTGPAFQLGTLGGGNHFIEVCGDERGRAWILLHSGSRNAGFRLGNYFAERAREMMARWHIDVPRELAYLPRGEPLFTDYIRAVGWGQRYAKTNRRLMMDAVVQALETNLAASSDLTDGWITRQHGDPLMRVDCHHNYVTMEEHAGRKLWITRKGAVRAGRGELGIIPGAMGRRSFIVEGLGHPGTYLSCSHGAGRIMSRKEAERRFTVADLEADTAELSCRKDAGVLDEIGRAYKDIDAVMAAQTDIVRPLHTLSSILCIKGGK